MHNMKVSKKLFLSFAIILILTAALGITSIFSLLSVNDSYSKSYKDTTTQLPILSSVIEDVGNLRLEVRNAVIYGVGTEGYEQSLKNVEKYKAAVESNVQEYSAYIDTEAEKSLFASADDAYKNQLLPVAESILEDAASGNSDDLTELMEQCNAAGATLKESMDGLMNETINSGLANLDANTQQATILVIIFCAILAASFIIVIIIARFLIKTFRDPIVNMSQAADMIAVGDTNIKINYDSEDEIGELGRAFVKMASGIREQADILAVIASGDYTVSIPVRSDNDVMNKAINDMLDSNNSMVSEIRTSSQQVSAGASQVAQGAQALAAGSTEQSASIQQISASINQVLSQAEESTREADSALHDVEKAGEYMRQGLDSMSKMTEAMEQINNSSNDISKVIKVIEDIAFQTNILALNAAVEAARAGEAGKGFAVVADEVRNLASKSAEAAKETSALIENSIQKVSEGNVVANETSEIINTVADISSKNAESMSKISEMSQEQARSISEVTQGINQISTVVQSNSATSEESAAASQEMSSQAQMMNTIVSRFKLRDGFTNGKPSYPAETLPSDDGYTDMSFDDSKY